MIDGQDGNDPSVTGLIQGMNNPDVVREIRIITNQFSAEHGRAAGSVVSIITKTGTSQFHGTAFWFHNDDALNSRTNLDERAGATDPAFSSAPERKENQVGGTLGGPLFDDRTFFFVSAQRWADRRLGSGTSINGVPTEEGRRVLQELAGSQRSVQALLENLPAAQSPVPGLSARFNFDGREGTVPLGTLTGASNIRFDDWQWSARLDRRLVGKHTIGARYLYDDGVVSGAGQVTPPGLTTVTPNRRQSALAFVNSSINPHLTNELRVAYTRLATTTTAQNPSVAERIPAIEVPALGLTGFNADRSRTGIGLAANLPQFRRNNTYQIRNTTGVVAGLHSFRFGADLRYTDAVSLFLLQTRGQLRYSDINTLVNDVVEQGSINVPLPGGEPLFYGRWNDYFFFVQDEWRLFPRLTLSLGLRYEYFGDALSRVRGLNDRILANFNNDPAYSFGPWPGADSNNFAPRFSFNFRLNDNTVMRGGYSRTYDYAFFNIGLNIFSSFPFVIANNIPNGTIGGFAALERLRSNPVIANSLQLTRTTVTEDFRSPLAEQFSFGLQRLMRSGWVASIGYVGTKGTGLFQTIDGNPRVPVPGAPTSTRVDPDRGVIRLRANAASSIYHSLQASLEKRYSGGLVMGAHYTWSSFIDNASEVFNAASSGDVALSQDSFNRSNDRGRSSYDRPHRFTTTAVYEFLWLRSRSGWMSKMLGGWQINAFLTLQSGAPFSPFAGIDPGLRLEGISGPVGNSIRPFLATGLDVSSMTVAEMAAYNRTTPVANSFNSLFTNVTVANPLGDVGRNTLRSDGIGSIDFGLTKNTRVGERHNVQIRAEAFNITNTRNFGIPEARINSANFLNQWGRDGGSRRVQVGLRYVF
jgi:outer membrane receptor protein involved in Fe transport